MIIVIDCGMGNLGSILNMLARIGTPALLASRPAELATAERIILPGVGAFDDGMTRLREGGWIDPLTRRALDDRTPVLGICLGMQMMMERSTEGSLPGLGWVPGEAIRFRNDPGLKVPHMGWKDVTAQKESAWFEPSDSPARYYFVHSYHCVCRDAGDILLTADHGTPFTAAFERGNVLGVQFHPEKSHRFGLKLLKDFATGPRGPVIAS